MAGRMVARGCWVNQSGQGRVLLVCENYVTQNYAPLLAFPTT
jgi:hypothetical protein